MLKFKFILFAFFSYFLRMSFFDFIVVYYLSKRCKPILMNTNSKVNIAILDIERFRDEIKGLKTINNWSLINLPISSQDKINALHFYTIFNKESRNQINHVRVDYLKRILPKIIKKTGITCFLSCGMYYARNLDWEIACIKKNIPFFCLHREGNGLDSKLTKKNMSQMVSSWRKFYGTKLFVGNVAFKETLIKEQYIDENMIEVVGSPRVDLLIKNKAKINSDRKKIVFFSFPHAAMLLRLAKSEGKRFFTMEEKKGFYNLFFDVHKSAALFAIRNPDIDVFIKPKWYSGDWKFYIDKAIQQAINETKEIEIIKNLSIVENISAQELILSSSLVVALNSSVIIESMLARVPVVLPCYYEATSKYKDNIAWSDYFDELYVARSNQELLKYLNNFNQLKPINLNTLDKMTKEAFGYGDGKNSKRLFEQIASYH
jgi:hypothetical protein